MTDIREELSSRINQVKELGHDSILERFVLENGTEYASIPYTGKRMTPKECFRNALVYAQLNNLRYAEGYALDGKLMESGLVLPMHHAWCVDDDNNAIDPTWASAKGSLYLGIDFSWREATDRVSKTKTWGLYVTGTASRIDLDFLRTIAPDFAPLELKRPTDSYPIF